MRDETDVKQVIVFLNKYNEKILDIYNDCMKDQERKNFNINDINLITLSLALIIVQTSMVIIDKNENIDLGKLKTQIILTIEEATDALVKDIYLSEIEKEKTCSHSSH